MNYWSFVLFIGIGVAIYFFPEKGYQVLEPVFTFGNVGLRKVKRRHEYVDTLSNLIFLICIVFSLFHFEIPYQSIIYGVMFWLSYACLFFQLRRITKKENKRDRLIVLYTSYVFAICSFLASSNLLIDFQTDTNIFVQSLHSNHVFSLFYILTNHEPMIVLLQTILYIASFYCLWAQIKYIRLENEYKARNMIFFCVKFALLCVLFLLFAYYGNELIHNVYFATHTVI